MLAIERLIDDDRTNGCAKSLQRRCRQLLHTMDEKSSDTSESESEPTSVPEAQPGTGKRERATPEGDGLDPTRYGDWEKNGRCIDF